MKVIISRILNKTDLAKNKSHGELVVGGEYESMMEEFFVEENRKQTFVDVTDGEEFEIWYRRYDNPSTPNPRVAPVKTYTTKHSLEPGDSIYFEKMINESGCSYYLEYARRINSGFFKGKSNTSVEVLNIEQFSQLVADKVAVGEIHRLSNGSYEMQATYDGLDGQLIINGDSELLELFFEGKHVEEFNKYYELDMSVNPYKLQRIATWSIAIELDDEEKEANEQADFELVKSVELDMDIPEDSEPYEPQPEAKAEKRQQNGKYIANRNKSTARKAIRRAQYKCEYNVCHCSFLRKRTWKPYMEPHHLIPLQFEDEFVNSLDVQANIVSLCSECHNKIHYGAYPEKMIEELWNKRKDEIAQAGIGVLKNGVEVDLDMLLKFYEL